MGTHPYATSHAPRGHTAARRTWMLLAALLLLARPPHAPAEEDAAPAPESLDLPGAIQRALEQNRTLLGVQVSAEASELGVQREHTTFDYRLTPSSSVGGDSDSRSLGYGLNLARRITWGTDISVGAAVTRLDSDGPADTHAGRAIVRVDQPLFRGAGRFAQLEPLRLAEGRLQRSRRLVETTKADLALSVTERYENLLRLQRLIASDEQTLARLDRLTRVTAVREHQGRATRLDTLRVDLQRGQVQTRIAANREDLRASQRAFADLLGDDPGQAYTLIPPPQVRLDLPPEETAIATALSNRLEYADALDTVEDARRGQILARRNLAPDLRLSTQVERRSDGPRAGDAWALDDTAWLVGLSSGSDLFNRADPIAFREAALDSTSTALDADLVRSRIQREVSDELGAYRRAWQEQEIEERNLLVAQRRRRLAERLYEQGRADNTAVADAEEAFFAADNSRNRASANASVAAYRVLRALGTLIEFPEELKP
jgi:outer membrane protein TolC